MQKADQFALNDGLASSQDTSNRLSCRRSANGEEITMSQLEQLEQLFAVMTSTAKSMETTRKLIGEQRLALIYAKSLLSQFGESLFPTTVAEVLGMSKNGAAQAIAETPVLKSAERKDQVSTFERLLAIASGEGKVFDLARAMIGENELALLLAKAVVQNTRAEELSPTSVS
jgi:hypothetical protein